MELHRPLSTVTPTLDGDVLAVLARSDSPYTTGQLRRVLAGPSEEGIRKVLQRLAKKGIVRATRVGNAFSYDLNRSHLAAEHVVGLARLQETFLDRLTEHLESWRIPPVYAAVFGSAARGSMTVASDLDLLLVRRAKADVEIWDNQVERLAADVTSWTGNDTRVLEYTDTELTQHGSQPVLRDVVAEGLTVVGSRAWLVAQLREEPR